MVVTANVHCQVCGAPKPVEISVKIGPLPPGTCPTCEELPEILEAVAGELRENRALNG